jgi:DNA-binding response OmpR family regulator
MLRIDKSSNLKMEYKIGDLSFDFINNEVKLEEKKLNLTKTEFNMLAFLAKNNCNVIQGFLISKALPINKCIELIEGYNVTHTLSVGQNKNKK